MASEDVEYSKQVIMVPGSMNHLHFYCIERNCFRHSAKHLLWATEDRQSCHFWVNWTRLNAVGKPIPPIYTLYVWPAWDKLWNDSITQWNLTKHVHKKKSLCKLSSKTQTAGLPASKQNEIYLVTHVKRISHNAEIIDDEDLLQIKWFPVLHYPGPQWHHKVDVE